MALFFTWFAKKYDPYDIDNGQFAFFYQAWRSVPLICTKMIDGDGYGEVRVNGEKIRKGRCIKFDFSPLPFLFIPVGEAAREFDKDYLVELKGFKAVDGSKFKDIKFVVHTAKKRFDDGKHKENEQAAKDVSDEGIVMLENDGILPLKEGTKIALEGDYHDFRISAIGAGLLKPRWTLTIEEAIAKKKSLIVDKNGDFAVFFISRGSGENKDNKPIEGGYYLSEEEKEGLLNSLKAHKKVILILNTGYPIEMGFIKSLPLSAIVWTGFPGQRGSESLVDILTGIVNPSGRLADTWPLDYRDCPSAHNFINLDEDSPSYTDDGKKKGALVYYEERQYVGYRYFDSYGRKPAFWFGKGLSYTSFNLQAEAGFDGDFLNVRSKIRNSGDRAGKMSLLVYVGCPKGRLDKPKRLFCGFKKTKELGKDESEELEIKIPAKDFSSFDNKKSAFILEKGTYSVYLGGSIEEASKIGEFTLLEEKLVEQSISVCAPIEEVGSIDETGKVKERSKAVDAKDRLPVQAEYKDGGFKELKPYKGKRITFDELKGDAGKLDDFVSQLSTKELVNFLVCDGSCWRPKQSGAAGRIGHSKKYGIPTFYMSDGNCSVNLNCLTTGFPSSNLLASTFNRDLAYKVGETLAKESEENGISINLGPGGNIHRNLLCGRHPEYFSEDPILAGSLMAEQARGLEENGVLATYKHLFANGMEFERKSAQSIIDERTIRELYLAVFDKALSLYKPSCFMTSYNPVNGIYPSENASLLNDLVRKEWGFAGFFMTDWGSYDTSDSIRMANAGMNMLTPGTKKIHKMVLKAAKRGEISKGALQQDVKMIIKTLLRCTYEN